MVTKQPNEEYPIVVGMHAQSGPTLCDSMHCNPSGSSVHGIFQARNTGVGCHCLLQGIVLIQGSNLHLLQWQVDSLPLSHLESPVLKLVKANYAGIYGIN